MTNLLTKLIDSKKKLFVGIAGPGTGKSTKFREIIESEEYKGKKILILSFINKLIDELSRDFKNFGNVEVSTLHAFARQQVGDVDLDQDLDKLVSADRFFIEAVQTDYQERLYAGDLTEAEEKFYKERKIFYKYEKELYSFSSIIYAANRFFRKYPDKVPVKYDLILVDEFQDFNKAECELIELLNTKSKVLLVGDDDQSLYHFKRARPEQIRSLYSHDDTEKFSLDYCYRCTEVIVNAVNDLIKNAKKAGYLKGSLNKKFLYPKDRQDKKNEVSAKYPEIDFIPALSGDLLIYNLAQRIKVDTQEDKGRILVLVPSYLKHSIYDGLVKKGLNVVEFELFSGECCKSIKHESLIEVFNVLSKRKTDNLALRKILSLYLQDENIADLIKKSKQEDKKVWFCLTADTKAKIEVDLSIFEKVKRGEDALNNEELKRFSEIFTLKNLLSKMIKGFHPVIKDATEVEMATVMSSKGLSAEFVYYIGIDNRDMLDRKTKELKVCEFLVGITRAKNKLTLISLRDKKPKILELLDKKYINRIE